MSLLNCLHPQIIYIDEPPSYRVALGHKGKYKMPIAVSCGHCELCQSGKRGKWNMRLRNEFKNSTDAYFITLTFDNDHLPKTGNGTREWQLFMKRLRKNNPAFFLSRLGFKYYRCSELGRTTKRLHMHALFFNTSVCTEPYMHMLVDESWKNGFVYVEKVNDENACSYISKYIGKSFIPTLVEEETGEISDCVDTFSNQRPLSDPMFKFSCSKGIGLKFLTHSMTSYLRARGDGMISIPTSHGSIDIALPKYYFDKVFPEGDPLREEIKLHRIIHLSNITADEIQLRDIKSQLGNGVSFGDISDTRSACQQTDEQGESLDTLPPRLRKYQVKDLPDILAILDAHEERISRASRKAKGHKSADKKIHNHFGED